MAEDKEPSCCIKLDHIPYGFFDKEILKYFTQFGTIVRVRVVRSKAGRFKGRAFVLFDDPQVARLAAEAMDNYLMFDKRIRARVCPPPKIITKGPKIVKKPEINRAMKVDAKKICAVKSDEEVKANVIWTANGLTKSLEKLRAAGYNYDFQFVHKLPPL